MLRNLLTNMRISFRMWVRNHSRPLTIEEAEEKKLFWSKVYVICGGLAFILITATSLANSSSREFSASLPVQTELIEKMDNKKQFRVINYSGFTKKSDVLMTKEEAMLLRNSEMEAAKNLPKEIN